MALDQSVVDKAGFGTSVTPTVPTIQQRKAEALSSEASTQSQLEDVNKDISKTQTEKAAALQPKMDERAAKAQEKPAEPKYEKVPEYQRPTIKPEELNETFGALMVASMLVGMTSRTPYNNAMTAMTGAMNGFMKKDQEMVEESMKAFDKNISAIKAKNELIRQELDDNWKRNAHDLKAMDLGIDAVASKYDLHLAQATDNRKSLTDKMKFIEGQLEQMETTVDKGAHLSLEYQKFEESKRHNLATEGGGAGAGGSGAPTTTEDMYKTAARFGMTKEAFEKAVDVYKTNQTLPANARAIKSLPLQIAIMNRTAEKYPDANVAVNKEEFKGAAFAYKQNEAREAAVHRITGALTEIQPRILELTKKVNTTLGGEFGNMTMNELTAKYGDNADVAELKNLTFALGREYVAATMMPGSNAQMHTQHSDEAKEMANGNMPINKMTGAIKGINEDVAATEHALVAEGQRLLKNMANVGQSANRRSTDVPAGIPAGSTFVGKSPEGKDVYQSPDGKKWVP